MSIGFPTAQTLASAHSNTATNRSSIATTSAAMLMTAVLLGCLLWPQTATAKVLHEERSLYTRISVDQKHGQRCLKFTLKRTNSRQSCLLISDPHRLVFAYTRMTMASLLLTPAPARILIVGLGGGTLPTAFRQLYSDALIHTVEIDPAVYAVAKTYFNLAEDAKNQVFVQDARVFGKRALLRKQQYDLIILDAFNGDYIPDHLMTVEFLQEMRDLMSAEGTLVANTFANSKLYDYESRTYEEVFGSFLNVREKNSGNRVIIVPEAAIPPSQRRPINKERLEASAALLREAMMPLGVPIDRYVDRLASLAKLAPDWNRRARPLTDQYAPANLLHNNKN